jgi:hypothetical protein
MEALADLGDRLEFVYTDISPQLVAYGRKTYGAAYPFATFRLLDVERHIEAQVQICHGDELFEMHVVETCADRMAFAPWPPC